MSWDSVPCHPSVRKIVKRAIQRDVLGRTTLVYGPPGAGQAIIGRAIANTYICKEIPDDFCGQCNRCRRIEQKIYPDMIEMVPEEDWSKEKKKEKAKDHENENERDRKKRKKREYSVDHMRVMQEQAIYLPYEGEQKIYVIHDAHCMNPSSANSLLKILEEPHSHLRFILLTDQVTGILPTIRSRCWAIRLLPMEIESLAHTLQTQIPHDQAVAIARIAGGLPEQAHRLMEENYLERRDSLLRLLQKIKKQESAVVEGAEEIAKSKEDLRTTLGILLRIVRDGMIANCEGESNRFDNLDRIPDLRNLWQGCSLDGLMESVKRILGALDELDRFVNPSVLLMDLFLHLRLAMKY